MAATTGRRPDSAEFGAITLAGLAGLWSIALGIAGVIVDQMWTFPATNWTGGEIAVFVHAHRSPLLIAMALTTTAVGLWLIFAAGVWQWLRDTVDSDKFLLMCFLIGVVSFVTLLLAGFTAFSVLVYRGGEESDPRLLYDLAFGLLAVSGVPTALALGSYAALAFRSSRLPTSTAVIAVLAAVSHLALLASLLIRSGFFSLAGGVTIAIPATLFAWIAATSLAMIGAY